MSGWQTLSGFGATDGDYSDVWRADPSEVRIEITSMSAGHFYMDHIPDWMLRHVAAIYTARGWRRSLARLRYAAARVWHGVRGRRWFR